MNGNLAYFGRVLGDEPKPRIGDKITVNGRIFDVKDKGTVADPEYVTLRMAYDAMAFGVSLWRKIDRIPPAEPMEINTGYKWAECLVEIDGATVGKTAVYDEADIVVFETNAVDVEQTMLELFIDVFNGAMDEGIKEGRLQLQTDLRNLLELGGSPNV